MGGHEQMVECNVKERETRMMTSGCGTNLWGICSSVTTSALEHLQRGPTTIPTPMLGLLYSMHLALLPSLRK